ncbi:MAG TPA: TIM barrel protein [Planctomycetota bacterium]|nr:TIM barrel protein [Planctomycetota bacterium]
MSDERRVVSFEARNGSVPPSRSSSLVAHRFALFFALFAAPFTHAEELFARDNLMAWCIVPFDAKKRGPEERAAMLEKLGFTHFAYDWRAEHVPTFDAEIDALQKHKIELTAWWFPTTLDKDATTILDTLERHRIKTQLWVSCAGGTAPKTDDERRARIDSEAARIKTIADAAQKIGCSVELYNHGGWLGEPETMVSLAEALKDSHVGIIYNLHHGHDHLDRLPEALKKMMPYLHAINLNGMTRAGEAKGEMILPIGKGELDLQILKTIRDSGYKGRIGILNHTNDDAETRLRENLAGLDGLVERMSAK